MDRMRAEGRLFKEIGAAIGRSEAAVGQFSRTRGRLSHRMCWTPAVVAELPELVDRGLTNAEIASHYNVSPAAIQVRKSVLGIAARKKVPVDLAARIVELTKVGKTILEIVETTGESRSRVAFLIRREGVIPQRFILRSEVRRIDEELLRLADAGTRVGTIAKQLGMAHGSVCSRLQTLRRRQAIRERIAA